MNRSGLRVLPILALPMIMVVMAACSSNSNKASSTNSSGSTGGGAASQAFDEATTDNSFSVTQMTTAANRQVTVTVTNKGQAIHSWHVLNVQDASGKEIKGALLDPSKSETLTFTIAKAGKYAFQCDVHPIDMKGTITVQ